LQYVIEGWFSWSGRHFDLTEYLLPPLTQPAPLIHYPSHFALRILSWLVLTASVTSFVNTLLLATLLLLGRWLLTLVGLGAVLSLNLVTEPSRFSELWSKLIQNVARSSPYDPVPGANDLYSVLFGLYFAMALVAIGTTLRWSAQRLFARRESSHRFFPLRNTRLWLPPRQLICRSVALMRKCVLLGSAYAMLAIVLPYLIGLLVDAVVFRVAVVAVFSVPFTLYRHFLVLQHYLFGLLCFKVWFTFVTTEGISPHWYVVWQNVRRGGYRNEVFLWREVVWPLTSRLLFMLSLPYFVGHALLPLLGLPYLLEVSLQRYVYLFFFLGVLLVKFIERCVSALIRIHTQIRNEKYLIRMQLQNFAPSPVAFAHQRNRQTI
jgi:hypothetical protein